VVRVFAPLGGWRSSLNGLWIHDGVPSMWDNKTPLEILDDMNYALDAMC
jgi:hypothetical protein